MAMISRIRISQLYKKKVIVHQIAFGKDAECSSVIFGWDYVIIRGRGGNSEGLHLSKLSKY